MGVWHEVQIAPIKNRSHAHVDTKRAAVHGAPAALVAEFAVCVVTQNHPVREGHKIGVTTIERAPIKVAGRQTRHPAGIEGLPAVPILEVTSRIKSNHTRTESVLAQRIAAVSGAEIQVAAVKNGALL